VLVGDIVEIGGLVRTGGLEWLYRLGLDGKDMKESLASATTDLRDLASSVKDPKLAEAVSQASRHGRICEKLMSEDCLELRKWVSRQFWGPANTSSDRGDLQVRRARKVSGP